MNSHAVRNGTELIDQSLDPPDFDPDTEACHELQQGTDHYTHCRIKGMPGTAPRSYFFHFHAVFHNNLVK